MTKQHASREQIVQLIRAGMSNRRIHQELNCCRRAVAAIRRELGIATFSRTVSVADQLKRHCTPADGDGHVLWTGALSTSGTPRLRLNGGEIPVTHVMFKRRTGRKPVGQVRSDCGVKGCVAPAHVLDDIERRTVRLQMRALYGLVGPWVLCAHCGSDWESEGRVEDSLDLYCRRCATDRTRRNRAERRER